MLKFNSSFAGKQITVQQLFLLVMQLETFNRHDLSLDAVITDMKRHGGNSQGGTTQEDEAWILDGKGISAQIPRLSSFALFKYFADRGISINIVKMLMTQLQQKQHACFATFFHHLIDVTNKGSNSKLRITVLDSSVVNVIETNLSSCSLIINANLECIDVLACNRHTTIKPLKLEFKFTEIDGAIRKKITIKQWPKFAEEISNINIINNDKSHVNYNSAIEIIDKFNLKNKISGFWELQALFQNSGKLKTDYRAYFPTDAEFMHLLQSELEDAERRKFHNHRYFRGYKKTKTEPVSRNQLNYDSLIQSGAQIFADMYTALRNLVKDLHKAIEKPIIKYYESCLQITILAKKMRLLSEYVNYTSSPRQLIFGTMVFCSLLRRNIKKMQDAETYLTCVQQLESLKSRVYKHIIDNKQLDQDKIASIAYRAVYYGDRNIIEQFIKKFDKMPHISHYPSIIEKALIEQQLDIFFFLASHKKSSFEDDKNLLFVIVKHAFKLDHDKHGNFYTHLTTMLKKKEIKLDDFKDKQENNVVHIIMQICDNIVNSNKGSKAIMAEAGNSLLALCETFEKLPGFNNCLNQENLYQQLPRNVLNTITIKNLSAQKSSLEKIVGKFKPKNTIIYQSGPPEESTPNFFSQKNDHSIKDQDYYLTEYDPCSNYNC